jgi:hypothetical protein
MYRSALRTWDHYSGELEMRVMLSAKPLRLVEHLEAVRAVGRTRRKSDIAR